MQNYIRNATRVFKRYCNRFLNSEKRFIEPDCKSSAWVQAYNEASRDLSDDGVKKLKKLTAFTKCDGFANDTLTVLEHFTRDDVSNKKAFSMLAKLENHYPFDVDEIQIDGRNRVMIKLHDGFISVMRMSELYPEFFVRHPEIVTVDRKQKCHYLSPEFAGLAGDDFDVVTGATYRLSKRAKFLHTWVESNLDGMDVVVDPTMNVVINKDGYYRLNHIKKPLERIASADIRRESAMVREMSENIDENYLKLYLSSRDEALSLARKHNIIEIKEK